MEPHTQCGEQRFSEINLAHCDGSLGKCVCFNECHQQDHSHRRLSLDDGLRFGTTESAEIPPSTSMLWDDLVPSSVIDPILHGVSTRNYLDSFQHPCCTTKDCAPLELRFDKCVGRFLDVHLAKWSQLPRTAPSQHQAIMQLAEAARAHIDSWKTGKARHGTVDPNETVTSSGSWHDEQEFRATEPMIVKPEPCSAMLDPSSLHSMPTESEDPALPLAEDGGTPSSQPIGSIDLPCVVQDCNERSKGPYNWKRHQAKHFPRWICMPYGTHIIGNHCGICGAADVTEAHRETHPKLDACLHKLLVDRSYRGLDKLCDHLKVHLDGQPMCDRDVAKRKQTLKSWESDLALEMDAFWCQRCEVYLDTWKERQEHILQHLKQEVRHSH